MVFRTHYAARASTGRIERLRNGFSQRAGRDCGPPRGLHHALGFTSP